MEERTCYFNGQYLPSSQVHYSIYDTGSMYGACVFEMTRSYNKKQWRLRQHLERLYCGIKYLRIPIKETIDELEKICAEVQERNDHLFAKNDEHRLMINVTPGPLGIYPGPHVPTVIVDDFPLRWTTRGFGRLYEQGGVDEVGRVWDRRGWHLSDATTSGRRRGRCIFTALHGPRGVYSADVGRYAGSCEISRRRGSAY
jgi:branched-subunit amino acid aminotransferase/4-amino-4-deoxychorismate lyase